VKAIRRPLIRAATLALLTLLVSPAAHAVVKEPPFTQADCADPTLTLRLTSQAHVESFPCTTVAGDLLTVCPSKQYQLALAWVERPDPGRRSTPARVREQLRADNALRARQPHPRRLAVRRWGHSQLAG
jgi:hypothetical protein